VNPLERGLDVLTLRAPLASRAVFGGLARLMALAPHLTGRLLADSLGHECDVRASLDDVGLEAVSPYIEAFAQGSIGPIADYRRLLRPWDFDPATIAVPVHLWHGDADDSVPLPASIALASVIVEASLHVVDGGDHAMIYAHIAEIAAAVSAFG
jgi:pimeloyl-ACP methyl ester carboxylesterase